MAHTLHEYRDLNNPKELFDDLAGVKIDPEMVQLASQLIQRQAGKYNSGDREDRYETRGECQGSCRLNSVMTLPIEDAVVVAA